MWLAGLPDGIPDGGCILWVAENFISEFPRVARSRYHDRDAVIAADSADGKAEPVEFLDIRLGWWSPDDVLEDVAA